MGEPKIEVNPWFKSEIPLENVGIIAYNQT